MGEIVIVEKREELGLPKEKVLPRELDGYMEAHKMKCIRVRNSDRFFSLDFVTSGRETESAIIKVSIRRLALIP